MNPLYISGFAAISSAGMQAGALAERAMAVHSGGSVEGLYPEPMPSPNGHALTDFDVKAHLGRKGTSFYDRATALAVVACGAALRDAQIEVDDECRARIGIALGTTLGSFKSTSDFSLETLIQPKPYLVNPVLFPNTVMNCAAGQAAIRYGLRGVNATVTGGPMAFLNVLRYVSNAIDRGYVDTMLAGAVEEYTPHRAWMTALRSPGAEHAGEAAAVFAISAVKVAPVAEILAVATGFGPGGASGAALTGCITRALRQAGVGGSEISTHASIGDEDGAVVRDALGHEPSRFSASSYFGDCAAATGAIALATMLDLHRTDPSRDGRLTLLSSCAPDGAAGAAIVRGWSGDSAHRG